MIMTVLAAISMGDYIENLVATQISTTSQTAQQQLQKQPPLALP